MSLTIPSIYRYIQSITIVSAGSGYFSSSPPTITISGGGGSDATATCTVVNGQINSVVVTNIGWGYTSLPTITVSGNAILTAVLSSASGTPTQYTTTISNEIKHTIPEFIREEYSQFVAFIEKYYEWMEEDGNPLNILISKKYNDVDYANDAELEKWGQQLAVAWPDKLVSSKKFLYKNIKELYETKGTRESFILFFRLFYQDEIEVIYPSNYILKSSDGKWVEEQSIKVVAKDDYEILNLIGKEINLNHYVSFGSVYTVKSTPASISSILKIAYTSPQIYEIFLAFPTETTTLEGPGSQVQGTIVFEGPISSVENIGAADALRTAGTYTITSSDYTTNKSGGSLAEFTITVDGTGAASVAITDDGVGFIIGETVTVTDANLGAGGAVDLTFDVATLVEGELKINGVTITAGGYDYVAVPALEFYDTAGGSGASAYALAADKAVTGVVVSNKGSGYSSTTTSVVFNNDAIKTFITLRTDQSIDSLAKGYVTRSLTNIASATYAGADAGFKNNSIVRINETGDDNRIYATDYFAEDYVAVGGLNNGYAKITSLNSNNSPKTWSIVDPGYGYQNATTNITIISPTNEYVTITLTTSYLFSYAGKWLDDSGKLSDVNKIQDNKKYQNYSYVIKSAIPQTTWDTSLRDTIHPAGWEVFGELVILNEIEFDFNILVPGFKIYFFQDDAFAGDGGETSEAIAFEYQMPRTDTATITHANSKDYGKNLADQTTRVREGDTGSQSYFAEDYIDNEYYVREGGFYLTLAKFVTGEDEAISSDLFERVVQYNKSYSDGATTSDELIVTVMSLIRLYDDEVTITDSSSIGVNKSVSDVSTTSDGLIVDYSSIYTDAVNISDSASINSTNSLTDISETSDVSEFNITKGNISNSVTLSDSGAITYPQDWSEDDTYFAEDYITRITVGTF